MILATIAAILTSLVVAQQQPGSATPTDSTSSTCPVTSPNHHAAPKDSDPIPNGMVQTWHGNVSVGTSLWAEGTIVFKPGGPGFVLSDGALQMKFFWLKAPGAHLTVSGQRLDGTAAPLRAEIDSQFDAKGFQPSYLIFPSPGCWRVTATAGGETLSFVTSVVKIGDGPAAGR